MQKFLKICARLIAVSVLGASGSIAADLYVAPSGSDANTGESWTLALATIGQAVANAQNGYTIWVSNGVYSVTEEIAVTSALTLIGFGGAEETLVQGNGADSRIFHLNHADAVLEGFTVSKGEAPTADLRGAGVLLLDGTVRACVIKDNISERGARGAGIYVVDGLLTNSVIQANQTKVNRGAGVYMAGGIMAGCKILDNGSDTYRATYGAGVAMETGSLVVDCLIAGNRGTASTFHRGGGVYMSGGVLSRSTIVSNAVSGSVSLGGGVFLEGGLVESCLVAYNVSASRVSRGGGGVLVAGGTLANSTVVENRSSLGSSATVSQIGAGVQWDGSGQIVNTIIHNNTRVGSRARIDIGGTSGYAAAFQACSSPELTPGVNGNLSADPRFADPARGDFRLRPDSPCVDAGIDSGVTLDLDGNPRPRDGSGNGVAHHDMGAFERIDANSEFHCFFRVEPQEAFHAVDAELVAEVFGPDTNDLYYWWDFGNGTLEGAGLNTVVRPYTTGFYDVSLTVSNGLGEVSGWSLTEAVRVGAPVVYVAPDGEHQAPFDTWSKAATNILEGVRAAVVTPEGTSRVVVSNGLYEVLTAEESIFIDRGITVESLSGATETVVSGTYLSEVYPNFDLDHPDAVVEGFTSRNANFGAVIHRGTMRRSILSHNNGNFNRGDDSGYGAGAKMFGGVLSHSLVLTNSIDGVTSSLRGGGVYMTGPSRVEHCIIAGNSVGPRIFSGGGGIATEDPLGRPLIRNSLLTGNLIQLNHSSIFNRGGGVQLDGGRVENCTIAGNIAEVRAGYAGAGLHVIGGEVVNTIVYGNRNEHAEVDDDDNLTWGSNAESVSYSCAPELTPGERGNLNVDPLFVDPERSNFRLQAESLCINAGELLDWMDGAVDLDGGRRVVARLVDMGAYEWVPPPGTMLLIR